MHNRSHDGLPNLVLAGVTKAGTTSLHHFLGQHPEVFSPVSKELNYFSPLVHGRAPADLSTYRRHFTDAADQPWRLDSSPFYFLGGGVLAAELSRTLDRPRILVSLRDPVRRLWSSFTYKKSKGAVAAGISFGEFFEECRVHFEAGSDLEPDNVNLLTLRTGCYAGPLQEWASVFGPDLRVLLAEDLAREPEETVAGVFAWLGIDTPPASLDLTAHNPTTGSRSVLLRRAVYAAGNRVRPVLSERTQARLKRAYARVNGVDLSGTSMTEDEARAVADFYSGPNAALVRTLAQIPGAPMPRWLTESGN